jgi:hypothetical protein
LPSAADAATRARLTAQLGRPAGGRRRRSRSGCPDASPAVRRSVRRADVRPPGRVDVRCPGVRCPGVRSDPGVRTDTRPGVRGLCVRTVRTTLDPQRVGAGAQVTFGGPGSTCCRRRQAWAPLRTRTAAAPRSPSGRPGSWSSARVLVDWLGSREGADAHKSSPQVRRGGVAGVMPDHGVDREVVTTLRGRCAGGRSWSGGSGGPIRCSGGADCGRTAAAVCAKRCPVEAGSALTSYNSGGRDRV